MDGQMNILQVVGYKNSGKTTLIEGLLSACDTIGWQVGVIKHHGHNQNTEPTDREKDTGRYRRSGAHVSAIAADGTLEMRLADNNEWEIQKLVSFYRQLPLDFILIEGFKQADFPKIVMVKSQEDLQDLRLLENVLAFVTWGSFLPKAEGVPVFDISEKEKLITYILSQWGVNKVDEALFRVTEDEIDMKAVVDSVIHPNAGAVNTFIGTVREMTNGKRTIFLKYEAYVPMAEKQLAQIGEEIAEKWPGCRTAITHRIGKLDISDVAVVIAVSSAHRAAPFEACRYAIERIKEIVPIWKKEHWEDGSSWIGNQKETVAYSECKPEEGKR